jgi:CheY-like chemotaxis protein
MSGLPKNQLRLLLIEDDAHDLFFMQRALEKAGFPPPFRQFQDGPSAIHYLQEFEGSPGLWPHLIVMDFKMPRMNGDEVLGWLRRHSLYHDLPVIILTSSDEPSDEKRTTRLGIFKFLTKEVHCDNLIATLDRFLTLHEGPPDGLKADAA